MKNAMQLKAIMKKLAKENQISAQLVLQNYMLERFLERVSLSPYRDNYIVCNDSGKIDKLPPNRLYGHTDFLAGTFFVCGSRRGDFVSLTDKQLARYEKIYHFPIVFLPTPHGLLAMKCTPEQYEQFQRDGNKLKIRPIDHGER